MQDPLTGLCASAGDGFHLQGPPAGRRFRNPRFARHRVRRGRPVIAQPPIRFDRASGTLEGANPWEQLAALALAAGTKISSHFSHRGYIGGANLLRRTLPERNIAIKLNSDAVVQCPYGDGYWSKPLSGSYLYEDELELPSHHFAYVHYM